MRQAGRENPDCDLHLNDPLALFTTIRAKGELIFPLGVHRALFDSLNQCSVCKICRCYAQFCDSPPRVYSQARSNASLLGGGAKLKWGGCHRSKRQMPSRCKGAVMDRALTLLVNTNVVVLCTHGLSCCHWRTGWRIGWLNEVQTHQRLNRTLFIRTKHNMRIFRVAPFSSYRTTLKS